MNVASPSAFVSTGGTSSDSDNVAWNFCFAKTKPALVVATTTIKDDIAALIGQLVQIAVV